MANYTAADIKELRERTGAGMMAVRNALAEADGNKDKAFEIIRVKGLAGVANREGRSTSEGAVAVAVADTSAGQAGVIVELNTETDFVAKNSTFAQLISQVLDAASTSTAQTAEELLEVSLPDGRPVSTVVDETAAVLGERVVVRRLGRVAGEKVTSYEHRTSKDLPPQVGVLVASDAAAGSVAHDVALHIAAFAPKYLTREEVPADIVADERRLAEETAKNEGKPEAALPKIVEGRLNGFFKANVLLDQQFAKDQSQTVGQLVASSGGTINAFVRFRVGA